MRPLRFAVLAALIAVPAACAPPTAGDDAGAGDAGAGDDDAGAVPPVPPACPAEDTVPDDSLGGSVLTEVRIEQDAPLALCAAWVPGLPLADEAARHVRVTIPAQASSSISRAALATRDLVGVLVERSPFAADQVRTDACSGTVLSFEAEAEAATTGDASLDAVVVHDLGAGGALVERIALTRAAGDDAPIRVDGAPTSAVSFTWEAADASVVLALETCGRAPGEVPAVAVLAGVLPGAGGTDAIAVVRTFRPEQGGAGAAQLYTHLLQTSAKPWAPVFVADWFAQLRGSGPDGAGEATTLDLTRDLAWWHSTFAPEAAPGIDTAIARVALARGSDDSTTVEVTTQDVSTNAETSLTYTAGAWTRVDAAALLGDGAAACADAEVFALGDGYATVLQLLTCPRAAAPGFDLVAVIPVLFLPDPALVGARVESGAFTEVTVDGRAGYSFAAGGASIVLTKSAAEGWFIVDVDTGDPALVQSFLAEPGPLLLREVLDAPLALRSRDGAVAVELVRRWAGQGVGESAIFAPVSFTAALPGRTLVVTAYDRLRYTNTHHNWNDALVALGDDVVATWDVTYDFERGLVYMLSATTMDGDVVLPATELVDTAGE